MSTSTTNTISKYQRYKTTYTKYHDCECGSQYNLNSKHNHLKSKKHKKYMEQKQQNETIINKQTKIINDLTNKRNTIRTT
jgi:hypothetical protein